MQLSLKLSVAIHCLVFIYENKTKVTSSMIAASVGTNPVVIRNLMSSMKKAGIITVQRGTGGASLAKRPEQITLYDIYKAVEPGPEGGLIGIHPCKNDRCPIAVNIGRALKKSYDIVEGSVAQALKSINLKTVIEDIESQLIFHTEK